MAGLATSSKALSAVTAAVYDVVPKIAKCTGAANALHLSNRTLVGKGSSADLSDATDLIEEARAAVVLVRSLLK